MRPIRMPNWSSRKAQSYTAKENRTRNDLCGVQITLHDVRNASFCISLDKTVICLELPWTLTGPARVYSRFAMLNCPIYANVIHIVNPPRFVFARVSSLELINFQFEACLCKRSLLSLIFKNLKRNLNFYHTGSPG